MARPIRSIDLYLPLDYNDGALRCQPDFFGPAVAIIRLALQVTTTANQFHGAFCRLPPFDNNGARNKTLR
jgi:hypothetical protein